jgi:pseurotin A synthetase (hybrid polyketide synthase/nonribosomal peptide synthetase)
MAPCAAAYLDSLQHCGLEYVSANPSCTWISSVHGFEMDLSSDQVDNEYWVENLMSPVLFTEAIEQAINDHGPFDSVLEIGPHPALRGPTLQILKALGLSSPSYHGTLNRNKDDTIALGGSLASMWRMMPFAVSLPQLQEALNHITLPKPHVLKNLPVYGWDHGTPYWRESRLWKEYRNRPPPHELLGSLIGRTEYEIRWRNILKPQELPWLKGHRFQNDILFPAAGYCMMALEAARNIWSDSIKLIELQDIDIRQGISFEDDSSGVEVIFCLTGIKAIGDVAEGTGCTVANFSCSASQVDGAQPLTTRCTGDLRVKLTRSSASSLPARSQSPRKEMHSVGLDSFYESMARIGLEFTGCFRRLLNAERTMYQSSASASPFPGTLSVQTGFLDSCFHTLFMAMPVPGDG